MAWLAANDFDVGVNRLTGLLGQLEPDGLSGLLTDRHAIDGPSVWSNVLDPEVGDIAAAQLTVDRYLNIARSRTHGSELRLTTRTA